MASELPVHTPQDSGDTTFVITTAASPLRFMSEDAKKSALVDSKITCAVTPQASIRHEHCIALAKDR